MKYKLPTAALLFSALTALATSSASAVLIAGWDGWADSGTDLFTATLTPLASGSAQGTITNGVGTIGPFNNSGINFGASADGTWGTLATPAASLDRSDSSSALGFNNTATGTLDFSITASSTISLTSFNFDSFRRFGGSANEAQLSILSGAITNGNVGSLLTIVQAAAGSDSFEDVTGTDFDVSLAGLADNILEAGETAVFRLAFTGGNSSGGGGNSAFLDNVGIFGDVVPIPEPSSSLLGLLGGGLLFLRRRR